MSQNDSKMKLVKEAIQTIQKQFGKGAIMRLGEQETCEPVSVISTGSLGLDLALGIGGWSLYHGYRFHHHHRLPLLIFALGIFLLFAKEIFHDWKLWFLIPAVVAITIAHYVNFRYCGS